jgi:outer membrane lipoprotein-sorting protein
MMRRWLLLLLLLSGCVRFDAPLAPVVPAAEDLLGRLQENAAAYISLDCVAQVALKHEGHYYPSRQFLLLEKPDRIRADVLTGFGQLVLQLASDGDQLSVLLNSSSRYLSGAASVANISRFIRIPLQAQELIDLLLYSPSQIAYSASSVVAVGDELILTLDGVGQTQEIRFDAELRPLKVAYRQGGESLLKITYGHFNGDNFPEQIIIEVPQEELEAKLSLTELQLNPVIDAIRFTIEKPDNVPLEVL